MARTCAFTASCRRSFSFDQILEEHQTLLSMQETNLERREEKLMEEQVHDLHSLDGRDLLAGLEELHFCMARIEDERTAMVVRLSWLVIEITDARVDLGVLPIWDIP
jgi:DNA replication initiation complex subunit (GINS family)